MSNCDHRRFVQSEDSPNCGNRGERHGKIIKTVPKTISVQMFLNLRRMKQSGIEDDSFECLDIIDDFFVNDVGFGRKELDRILTNESLETALTDTLRRKMYCIFTEVTTGKLSH